MRPITWLLKLLWSPFGLILNRPLAALWARIRAALRARSGEAGQRRRDTQRYASLMLAEFKRFGLSRTSYTGKKKRKRKRENVSFEYPLLCTRDELWLPIDLARLPVGINTTDLRADELLTALEDRLNAPVRYDLLPNGKFCYVVRLGGSKFPGTLSINAFQMPPAAPPLAFALGADHVGEHQIADLTDLKHFLIVGATGGGKTTFIHNMLYWFISRNTAQELELWLIDMKNGAELGRYEALLHSRLQSGIVRHVATEPPAAIDTLNAAFAEITKRNNLMKQHDASNIDDLEKLTGIQLRRIVVVVDEFAMLMLNKSKIGKYTIGKWAEDLFTQIASLGRSAGVHLVIATQFIQADVISGIILANFENRICFSVADWRKSQIVLESSDASGLPTGRAIFRREGKNVEYQTCLITPDQTRLEINRIKRHGPGGGLGEHDERTRFARDAKLLLSTACEQLNGEFSRTKLMALSGIRGIISEPRYHEIAKTLERDGVLEPGRGKNGRRVVRGFFNRPHLLDILYAPPHSSNTHSTLTVNLPESSSELAVRADIAEQEAENEGAKNSDFAVSSEGLTTTPHAETPEPEEEPDIEIPDIWLRAFEQPTEPPSSPESPSAQPEPPTVSPKPKRTRKPRAPKKSPEN